MLRKPKPREYASYYGTYIGYVKGKDFIKHLIDLRASTIKYLSDLSADQWDYRYEPEKWSVKEVLLHIIDTERIFSYRALRIGRNDQTALAGFEQNDYVNFYHSDQRTPASIVAEYKASRSASIHLYQNFQKEDLNRIGKASGFDVSVLALGFMTVGHEMHHIKILKERYFPKDDTVKEG